MPRNEASLESDDLVSTSICRKRCFYFPEEYEGSIGAATVGTMSKTVEASGLQHVGDSPEGSVGLGDADSVVERQTKSLVSVVTALILEQVRLDILEDGEEHAAGLVSGDTAARAGDALGDRG